MTYLTLQQQLYQRKNHPLVLVQDGAPLQIMPMMTMSGTKSHLAKVVGLEQALVPAVVHLAVVEGCLMVMMDLAEEEDEVAVEDSAVQKEMMIHIHLGVEVVEDEVVLVVGTIQTMVIQVAEEALAVPMVASNLPMKMEMILEVNLEELVEVALEEDLNHPMMMAMTLAVVDSEVEEEEVLVEAEEVALVPQMIMKIVNLVALEVAEVVEEALAVGEVALTRQMMTMKENQVEGLAGAGVEEVLVEEEEEALALLMMMEKNLEDLAAAEVGVVLVAAEEEDLALQMMMEKSQVGVAVVALAADVVALAVDLNHQTMKMGNSLEDLAADDRVGLEVMAMGTQEEEVVAEEADEVVLVVMMMAILTQQNSVVTSLHIYSVYFCHLSATSNCINSTA